jgi:CheY-like chemotaxis protein
MARIIVIDDEAPIRAMLEKLLTPAGHKVVLAADGVDGVNQLRAAPADLIITDMFMPNQEGLDLIIQLRKEFPKTPIIAMSGKPAGGTLLDIAQRLGAVTILQKPFNAEQFLEAVGKIF